MADERERETAANNLDEDGLPFEEALARLESMLQKLEEGELSLDESLACYEVGIRYLRRCHALLRDAERRISLLTEVREDGTAVLERFEEQAMTLEEKQESRDRRRSGKAPRTAPQADVDTQKGLF
jgi:exodeoxyribonuclease VII small subunit